MTDTVWRPVPGYTDLYANMDGGIAHGERGCELKQTVATNGYVTVRIPKTKNMHVHRLVAAAFFGPCPLGMEVRHGPDSSRANNRVENLCYGTRRDNVHDAMCDGTHAWHLRGLKPECSQGHLFSPENTYIDRDGYQNCRTCRAIYARKYRARRRERMV